MGINPYTGIDDFMDTTVTPAFDAVNPLIDNSGEFFVDPSAALEGLASAEQVGNLDIGPEVVPMTEEQAAVTPVGQDPLPTKADRLAASREILGTNEPQMIDKEVGSTSTTTSRTVESPESKQAQQDMLEAQAASKAASDKEMQAVAAENEATAKRDQQDNEVIAQVEDAKANAILENKIEFDVRLQNIEQKQADLASLKPETFWGSKTTADKITAALSVGLGAYGQALLGSGQNIGQVLLERNMQEFDRNQQLVYNNKLKEIEGMKGSLETKRKLADDALDVFDAQKLAGRARVSADNAKALSSAKTVQMQSAIAQRQSKMDMDVAKIQGEIARDREQKISTTTEKKILQRMERLPGTDAQGNPIKLTEQNNKARLAYADIVSANKALGDLKPEKWDEIADSFAFKFYDQDRRLNDGIGNIPWVGGAGRTLLDIGMGGTPEDRAANDKFVQLKNAADAWTRGVIRYKSGAAIAFKEFGEERDQYWARPGDSKEDMARKRENRQEIERAMRQAGALE